jgi:predicted chitinase
MTRAEAIDAIIAECVKQGVAMREQIAYVLATAIHEAGSAVQPVREAHFLKNPTKYLRKLRYWPYYGRGLVQLTWKANYLKYEKILGLPLVANPDLVLRFDIAVFILVHGMKNGTFTGKKLSDYVRPGRVDFVGARRIINGTDRAKHIAEIADDFVSILARTGKP